MKPIINLIQRLSLNDPKLRYPEYAPEDGKVHILYMAVPYNATGFYRCILPAIELNKTQTHCAIINDIQDWHQDKRFMVKQIPITDQLIRWAHHIVLTTVLDIQENFLEIIRILRNINPDFKLYIDVDDDILNVSLNHPNHNKYTPQLINNFLKNINFCDGITCTHQRLCNWYASHADKPKFYTLPNLMSRLTIPEIPLPAQNSNPITIGITANSTQFADLMMIQQTLKNILKKYGNKVQILLFGWDGKHYNGKYFKNVFERVKHLHIKPVIITDYFTALQTFKYDIALMPLVDNQFNRMKSNHKLLQYAMLGIPAIAPDMPPYNEPAIPGKPPIPYLKVEHGEWDEKITLMIETKIRPELGANAKKVVENYFIEDNIDIWQKCFK